MSWPLVQVAILVTMTHTVRAIADRLGPRWGALVLGMPSTTAVLLVTASYEGGASSAALAAESSLLGLVATALLPIAYAAAIRRRWGVPAAPVAAMAAYFLMGLVLVALPPLGLPGTTLLAMIGVAVGCRLARRLPASDDRADRRPDSRSMVLRTVVPAVFLVANRALRLAAGPGWSGTFTTFPAMSLAVLVSLHLESGRGPALRMARSMPRGNFLMIAFLVAFRVLAERVGPIGAAIAGYGAVAVTAGFLVLGERIRGTLANVVVVLGFAWRDIWVAHGSARPNRLAMAAFATVGVRPGPVLFDGRGAMPRPRALRRFAPRIEPIAA